MTAARAIAPRRDPISTPAPADAAGRRPARGLGACLVLALVVRLAGLVTIGHPELRAGALWLTSDEPSFHDIARAVAETGRYDLRPGGPPTAFRPPGMILPLAALYRVVAPSPFVAFAWVLACGLGVVALVHRAALLTWGDARTAFIGGAIAALMPTLVFASTGIWSEPQTLVLELGALCLLLQGAARSARGAAAAGALLGFAYLTRPSVGAVIPLVVAGVLLAGGARAAVALGIALVLPVVPWALRNRATLGEPLTGATVAGEALWGSNNPVVAGTALPAIDSRDGFDLYAEAREGRYLGSWVPMAYIPGWSAAVREGVPPEMELYRRQLAATRAFIQEEPGTFVRLLGRKVVRLVTVDSYAPSVIHDTGTRRLLHRLVAVCEHWFVFLAGGAGLAVLARADRTRAVWYAVFVAAGLVSVLVTYPNPRFLLPVTTVLMPLAARALVLIGPSRSGA